MKRPQRNLLIILSACAVLWLVLMRMPGFMSLWVFVAVFVFLIGLVSWSRDFVIGRYRMSRREWRRAAESYEAFEKKLAGARWSAVLIPIYLTMYTFDGVAIARNNIGQCLLNMKDYEGAVRWLRSALQRDPLYAVPYVNLGIVAALRNDREAARIEFRRAVELGFSPAGADELLRRALTKANQEAGRDSHKDE